MERDREMKPNLLLNCRSRLARASWSDILFGEEFWPMLLLLLACGLGFFVLARDALPAILAVVLVGLLAHAWLWCRAAEADAVDKAPAGNGSES